MSKKRSPVPMLCTYRPKRGRESALLALLRAHWPALRRAGLATDEPAEVIRCDGKRGGTWFVEAFSWADEGASERAHLSPDVMAIWGPMAELLDSMELARAERVEMRYEVAKPPRAGARRRAPPRRSPRPRRTAR